MPTKPAPLERKLNRSTLKQGSSAEGCSTLSTVHPEEENISCEITSIGDQTKSDKRIILPHSQLGSKGVTRNIRSEDRGVHSTKAKVSNKNGERGNDPVIFGLSDLGSNFAMPTRPASTSRMLPRIARRHLQKDTVSFLAKPKPLLDNKLASNEEKGQFKAKFSENNKSNESTVVKNLHMHEEARVCLENKSTPQCVSVSIRRGNNLSECVLNPNNLQSLTLLKPKATLSERKIIPKAPQPPKSKTSGTGGETSTGYRNKKTVTSSNQLLTNPTSASSSGSDVPKPSQSFMPIISVRNLQIDDKNRVETQQNSFNQGMTRSLNSRPLQSRERDMRLRKTHPLIPPDSVKTDLSTIMKARPIK